MTTSFITLNNVQADAHAFRVTLNIIMNSTNCPDDLAAVIEKLRDEYSWNRHNLEKSELESIYAHVDTDLCEESLGEWNVETYRMRDWTYPYSSPTYTDWYDGTSKVDCRLCGHRDNRFEFPLVNSSNGREIWTGSTCIVKYGVTVDGDGCAETALAKLRDVMGKSKTAQKRAAWQEEHDDAHMMIDKIREAMPICSRRYTPWSIKDACDDDGDRIIPANFDSQRRLLAKWGRATIKYFDKNLMLSPKRTNELWEQVGGQWVEGAMARLADMIVAKWREASENSNEEKARKYWKTFRANHPNMSDYQNRQVQYFADRGYGRGALYGRNAALVKEIEDQHKTVDPKASKKPTGMAKIPW